MLNKITIGISQALDSEFGYENNIDEIEQGINAPCFLITSLTTTETHVVMKRYDRGYPFMIQYFPKNKDYRTECNDVSERFFNCLECITVDGNLLRGSNMSSQIIDGVLNFEVSFNMQITKIIKSENSELMEHLTQNFEVKE